MLGTLVLGGARALDDAPVDERTETVAPEETWAADEATLDKLLAAATMQTVRTRSDYVELNIFVRSPRAEYEAARPPVAPDMALPRAEDVVLFDLRNTYAGAELETFTFRSATWYPIRADHDSVLLVSTTARVGTRPSQQQLKNRANQAVEDARREQLAAALEQNQKALSADTSNATEIGRLYLERQQLQAQLAQSLALRAAHADRIAVHEMLRLPFGVHVLPGAQPEALWLGRRTVDGMRQFRVVISAADPSTPASEFG